jgi:transcriptional regulator with XRE-family HTH domain
MSQADLGFEAGISIKHLSYVEIGKAAGSRGILLQLASALDLSLRDRNGAAGGGRVRDRKTRRTKKLKPGSDLIRTVVSSPSR